MDQMDGSEMDLLDLLWFVELLSISTDLYGHCPAVRLQVVQLLRCGLNWVLQVAAISSWCSHVVCVQNGKSMKIMEWQKGDKDLEGHEMVDDLAS